MLYTSTANDDNDINRIMQAALNAMGLESRTATAVTVMWPIDIDGLALYPGSSGYPTATRATANQMARNHTRSSLPIREFQRRQFRGQLQIWDQRRAQLQRLLELTTTTQVSNNSTIYPQPTLILQRQRFELIRRNATRMAAMTQNYNTTQWLHVGKEVTLKVLTMLFNMLLASISYIHRYPARFPNPKRELLSLAQYLVRALRQIPLSSRLIHVQILYLGNKRESLPMILAHFRACHDRAIARCVCIALLPEDMCACHMWGAFVQALVDLAQVIEEVISGSKEGEPEWQGV